MSVALPGVDSFDTSSAATARMPIAIASSHALPQAAVDELWRRHQPRVLRGWPLPAAPSHNVVEDLLADAATLKANIELTSALAAVVKDSSQLDRLIATVKDAEVLAHARRNPHLSQASRAKNPFTEIVVDGTDAAHEAARRFLAADVASVVAALADVTLKGAMIEQLAGISSMVRPSKPEIFDSMLQEAFPSQTPVSGSALQADDSVRDQWVLRQVRGAVLEAISADRQVLAECGAAIAATGRLVDPYCIEAIEAAVELGLLSDTTGLSLSAYAAARAEVICPATSPLRNRTEAPRVSHKRKPKQEALNIADSDQDLYLAGLELLGLSDAAARIAISSGDLSDDEFNERLVDADAQTVVDWAERRLAQQPAPGQVAEVIDDFAPSRQQEILDEVKRRPNPLEMQPELALCLPEATLINLDDRSAVFIAVTAFRAFGENPNAWSLAMQLLVQGWNPSILELIRSVEAITIPA